MVWSDDIITGALVTSATIFGGDVMNKINNMFAGVAIGDVVVINTAVTWTFQGSSLTVGPTGFTNLQHAHLAVNSGGQITEASISDLQAYLLGITGLPITDLSDVAAKSGTGTTVLFQGSPVLTTPTIASFVNSTHDHLTGAGGGTITEGSISDLQSYLLNITGELITDLSDVTAKTGTGTTVVFDTSPTIVTPTIAATGWTNATHAHLAGNSGGQITEASISDLQSYLLNITAENITDLSDVTAKSGSGTTVIFDTSPTIVTPTIASFLNAAHDHSDAAGGANVIATTGLSATGTKDSTTFLRGDNTWDVPPGGSSLPVVDTTSIAEGSGDATKEVRFEVDGNTTGVVGVLATIFTTAKTLTFPDATDTLVGKATVDAFTNKSYDLGGTGNVLTGSLAEFNTALQSDTFVTAVDNLTALSTSTLAQLNTHISDGTLLNTTNNISNMATSSSAEFNTANSDGTFFFISNNIADMGTSTSAEFDAANSDGTFVLNADNISALATSTKAQFDAANSEDAFAYLATANTFTLTNTFASIQHTGRHQYDKGANVASTDAMTLGTDGNVFEISGTTGINHILVTDWQIGSTIILYFQAAVTLNHLTGGLTGDQADLALLGDGDYTTSAGDVHTFVLRTTTVWEETARNSAGGSGDVTGPSSVDNDSIVTFSGTTGKIIKESTIPVPMTISGEPTWPRAIKFSNFNTLSPGSDSYIALYFSDLMFNVSTGNEFNWSINGTNIMSLTNVHFRLFNRTILDNGAINFDLTGVTLPAVTEPYIAYDVAKTPDALVLNVPSGLEFMITHAAVEGYTFTPTTLNINGNNISQIQNLQHDQSVITYATSIAFDFDEDEQQTIALTGVISTMTTSNRAVGKSKTVFITGDSSTRVLTFNTSWNTNPSDATATVGANAFAVMTFTCTGTAEGDVWMSYADFDD